jgi:hypothetical protein
MINSSDLLATLQDQLRLLLDDLRGRVETEPSVGDPVRAEYHQAFDAERTAWTFTEWSEDRLTQVAVGWLLACVFVRFGEDNGLIDDALIAGTGARGAEARAAQQDYFRANPHGSDRDYLHDAFRKAAALPGLSGVVGEGHSPLWLVNPSADASSELLALFRRTDDSGALVMEFTDPERNTRFLGDLYQDLSQFAKKTYALLQTPGFIEEFILDRTLDPATESFGLANTTLIDPACGSGHFLLGAFDRLWRLWAEANPADLPTIVAQQALDAVWGVDLNPFAAAIARFRLLVAALRRCNITRLADAPDFTFHVAVGDSLLWGAPSQQLPTFEGVGHQDHGYLYATEDAEALRQTFSRRYAAVVGNPPYIVPKDAAANAAYRAAYDSCSGKYSLGVPFTELFFDLAEPADQRTGSPAGYVGEITANSFMKREMGKKLIEQFIPKWDLTHVIDTSGAYIPGHGTPTVILFGRNQPPVTDVIRTVMGIRGEPSTPADPTKGLVWSAIIDQIDMPGSESEFVSVADTERSRFATHPWSIGGGGAAELKEKIDSASQTTLASRIRSIGFASFPGADEAFIARRSDFVRWGITEFKTLVVGEVVRDWAVDVRESALAPYDQKFEPLGADPRGSWFRHLWPNRTVLGGTISFGGRTRLEQGDLWWTWYRWVEEKYRTPLSIAFAFVATHNHFVLDRGGKVFKQSAPVIKLSEGATVDDHLGLLALLNSSSACFWMKQVFHNKGASVDSKGARQATVAWDNFYEFDGTKMQQFPLPGGDRPVEFGRKLDDLATALAAQHPNAVAAAGVPTRIALDAARAEAQRIEAQMVAIQEELDWHCLWLYGLTDDPFTVPEGKEAPPLALGERAFEVRLARQIAAGEVETAWFTRFKSTPITEIPTQWPDWYRDLVQRRIDLIESDRDVALVERAENKRRWSRTPWEELESAALREWLLDRLEDRSLWFEGDRPTVRSVGQLADRMSTDEDWMSVARLWGGQVDIDALSVVSQLVADEHVPAQAAARYKPSGLAKRVEWERTWEMQRAEDQGEDVGRIAVPPKYGQADFLSMSFWRQRGKLDVPKERFTSVHGAERDVSAGDSSQVLAWAGFDHAQMAQSLATLLYNRQSQDGWTGERLLPLIAALDEVMPWVAQWHPEVDPGLGQPLAAFYRGQVDQALASIGATRTTLADWRPVAPARGRKRATKAADVPSIALTES